MNSGPLAPSSNAPAICSSYGSSYGVSLICLAMGDASTLLRNIRASRHSLLIILVGIALFFFLSAYPPAAEPLTRISNRSKKRQSPARFRRYLDFIAALRTLSTNVFIAAGENCDADRRENRAQSDADGRADIFNRGNGANGGRQIPHP